MAKLYFNPEFGTIVARRDDDNHGVDDMIEITAEQGTAISLSVIGQMISNLYDVLDDKLGKT
jgi:hypothetical protein